MNHRVFAESRVALIGLLCSCGVTIAAIASVAPAENWPQWRGPLQSGAAPSADPPTTWSETNNIRWKVKIPGEGSATPLVWDNLVFIQAAIPTGKKLEPKPTDSAEQSPAARPESSDGQNRKGPGGGPGGGGPGGPGRGPGGRGGGFGGGPKPTEVLQFAILCLERQTGKVLWQQVAREEVPHEGVRQGEGTFASASGVTDGQHVWAYFGSRGLYCYDLKGTLVWNRDLGKMRVAMGFGEGSSPTLYEDTLIVNWDNEDGSFITALDKNTGKTLWKESRDEGTSWSTPLVVEKDGKTEVVVTATRKIRSYDPASGKLNWECSGLTRNVIPSPVADSEMVYCISGFQGNALLAIHLGGKGDLTGTDAVAWTHKKSTPYVPSPLLYNGKLYFYANNNGVLSCLDAKTGQALFDAERIEGLQGVYASPIGAAGKVYLAGRNGATVVLKQADKLELLATNRLEDKFDASPVAVGKDLLLRGREYLYCIAEK
ncbi:MAG TPA: PQQ-binding-like beta-propeller repeat protein [Candidatus Binatia bacterium]|jgi:outer membrane protein assembly factor BamB|nr:PQQ-binding-like beta-propeller repeat protein [Candidatus Binatia bacterium]